MEPVWRFIDTGAGSGAFNMRFDEECARGLLAGSGQPTVRLFQWHPWAVSLGFNQHGEDIDAARCRTYGFDIVRRPTGGRAILHAQELTYSVVMNTDRRSVLEVYNDISRALVRGLRTFGVDVELQKSQPNFAENYRRPSSVPCFTSSARYEIEWRGRKLVGSAQRRFHADGRAVVLQHGSILTGPAHRRLADCLATNEEGVRACIREEMEQRTTDLQEITGKDVPLEQLRSSMKRGFAEEWGIEFRDWHASVPPGSGPS